MTTTAAEQSAKSTEISVAGALVFQKTDYRDRVVYTLDVVSPCDAQKVTELVFSWTEEPEFRVSPEGDPVLPWVRAGAHKPVVSTPKYVQKAAAEAAELIAAYEEDRHRVPARTPEENEAIGPYVTRAQHVEMIELRKLRLEDYDEELVVAVLRAALENGWLPRRISPRWRTPGTRRWGSWRSRSRRWRSWSPCARRPTRSRRSPGGSWPSSSRPVCVPRVWAPPPARSSRTRPATWTRRCPGSAP